VPDPLAAGSSGLVNAGRTSISISTAGLYGDVRSNLLLFGIDAERVFEFGLGIWLGRFGIRVRKHRDPPVSVNDEHVLATPSSDGKHPLQVPKFADKQRVKSCRVSTIVALA